MREKCNRRQEILKYVYDTHFVANNRFLLLNPHKLSTSDYLHYRYLEDKEYLHIDHGELWCVRVTAKGIDALELGRSLRGDDD